jgi:hypothetical protein
MNQARTTMDFLLSVAHEAILLRAAKDGYEPGDYDAATDPEGYIVSLLNALHQWCQCNGIEWEGELAQAQGFFEQDLAESQPGAATTPSAPSVSSAHPTIHSD